MKIALVRQVGADVLVDVTALPDVRGLEPDIRVRAGTGVGQARQHRDEAFHPLAVTRPRVRGRRGLVRRRGRRALDREPDTAHRVRGLRPRCT